MGGNSSGVGDGFTELFGFDEVDRSLFLFVGAGVRLGAGELREVTVTLPVRFLVVAERDFSIGTKCTATGFG